MFYLDTDIDTYIELNKLLPEVWSGVQVRLLSCDYNLQRLGFVEKPPCRVEIELTRDEMFELLDKLMDFEVNVYMYDDMEDSPAYQDYCRYIWMWPVLEDAVENADSLETPAKVNSEEKEREE